MVYYLTTAGHQYPWRKALEHPGAPVATRQELLSRVQIIPYERFFQMRVLPAGSYVFADLDRLGVEATERAALLRRVLRDGGPGVRLFNDPIQSMRRFELLRHLHARGLNTFNVHRLADVRQVLRFPVFIRAEDGHDGSLTPLLHDSEELCRAIDEMVNQGKSRDNKLIVEYVDCRDESRMHHKFSALFVCSKILQATRSSDPDWVVKSVPWRPGPPVLALPRADHHRCLDEVMRLANIDYGRVDYAIVGDRVQVFEINTNPVIWPPELLLRISRALDEERTILTHPGIRCLHSGLEGNRRSLVLHRTRDPSHPQVAWDDAPRGSRRPPLETMETPVDRLVGPTMIQAAPPRTVCGPGGASSRRRSRSVCVSPSRTDADRRRAPPRSQAAPLARLHPIAGGFITADPPVPNVQSDSRPRT